MNSAYFDSFCGLVPCEVLAVWTDRNNAQRIPIQRADIRFTSDMSPPYRCGEELRTFSNRVVPPSAVIRRRFSTSIGPFTWEDTTDQPP